MFCFFGFSFTTSLLKECVDLVAQNLFWF